ncbi:winged helix-turn-helix transcriptional regulator [Corynebacterium terpenotabidum]|uniref:QorR DNA-binding transcription regulator n=1 Tax=Corynebacterium terpenotabidum Y-11 TaxID=1200352 RepID=S4XIY6_9CORY|nr:helix-turn-helix domain-containing protein [Corynebacterium terpenotabidum]AGP31720.1 QorR DNA-binding transcription regulator [Corynebacterium terpenotabidum Y-11]
MSAEPSPHTWNPTARDCPSRTLFATVGDRWNMLILLALDDGDRRFGELKAGVDGISDKVLTQRLSVLTDDGLVERTAYAEIPPRVVYRLTPLGRSALTPIYDLYHWTVAHMDAVVDSRGKSA